jgi:hypothetical protein
MKKAMLALLILISITEITNAQKGSYLLYGNVGFTSATDFYGETSNSYIINPGIGYQMNDNWTLGLNVGLGGNRQEVPQGTSNVPSGNYTVNTSFNIGPFIRRTYSISNIFSVYGQLEFNYLSGTYTPNNAPVNGIVGGSYNGFGTDIFPALGINIKNGWALNLDFGGLSYQTKTYKGAYYTLAPVSVTNSANQFAVTFGQSAVIGISKNFGGSKKK